LVLHPEPTAEADSKESENHSAARKVPPYPTTQKIQPYIKACRKKARSLFKYSLKKIMQYKNKDKI
jgi:hypothetical protein